VRATIDADLVADLQMEHVEPLLNVTDLLERAFDEMD
jgi:hypothetical protein